MAEPASLNPLPGDGQSELGAGGSAGALEGLPPLFSQVAEQFPIPGQAQTCSDTRLVLDFEEPVILGRSGLVQIFAESDPATPVESIDLAASDFTDVIAGRTFRLVSPVFVEGSRAVISPRTQALQPGQSYFVTVDAGVFASASGAPLGAIAPGDWSFTTGAADPASDGEVVVALDGTGDFCTVQGAVDFAPQVNATPFVIELRNGSYREIVHIAGKQNLTLRGEDRELTRIAYPNNEILQAGLGTRFRAMVEAAGSDDLVIENLTLHNTTPQGGSQAETLYVDNAERVILRNANFISRQDTLLVTGTAYVENCYIEGNVDYIWGEGTAYFQSCEIRTVARAGYVVQARNSIATFGFVFVDSQLTAEPGITGHLLARIEADRFPDSSVTFINCQMGEHVAPAGWSFTPATITPPRLRFWEYQSTTLDGAALDVSARSPVSRQLTDDEAAMFRDKASVLRGWNPTPE